MASLRGAGDARAAATATSSRSKPWPGTAPAWKTPIPCPPPFPADPLHDYPYGLVRLDLPACAQARLHLHVHEGDFDAGWRFRVYAPLHPEQPHTYAWRDLPFTRDGNVWTVTVTDNELGDLRAGTDAILFQGGLARTPILFRNGFETP